MRPAESFIAQPVRSLQTMLRVIREDAGYTDNVIPDGIYGSSTMEAVSQFQREHALPVTGVTDQVTWDRIVAEYGPALVRVDAAQPLQLILNPGQVIKRSERHPYLYLVQSMLLSISEVYGSVPAPPITGILDLPTAEALSAFQYLNALPQTGELDKITWKHLALQYPLAVNHRQSKHPIRR
ncbi:MAG: peptidoglycan-binding protein [Oscillospiraceae bacterium]|nr:peptidoglycan-binding protein [Oscillospiraceae bacterium]